jgi:hypothetical protein
MGRMLCFLAATLATFNDPAGRFQFSYPPWLQLLTGKRIAEAATLSYLPLCNPQAIVCVVEPATEFKNTSFEGASFQVAECPKPDAARLDSSRTINGLHFDYGTSDSAAAGHSLSAEIYRTVHGGACFEARISTTRTSVAIAPAGTRKLSPIEEERVERMLTAILDSFHFLTP